MEQSLPQPDQHTTGDTNSPPPPPPMPPVSAHKTLREPKNTKGIIYSAVALSVLGLLLSFIPLGLLLAGIGFLLTLIAVIRKATRSRQVFIALIATSVTLVLSFLTLSITLYFVDRAQVFENLAKECKISSIMKGVNLRNDSLELKTRGEYSDGVTFEKIGCALDYLDAPSSVRSKMNSTRALDGMQTASWSGYLATWTYHPDNGMKLILERS